MPYDFDDPRERARAASDPACPPDVLQRLAQHAELRPLIATNRASYPALLEWLASLGEPAVDAALASRAQPEVASRGRRIRPAGWWIIGASAAVVVALVATAVVTVAVPAVARETQRADSPFFGTPGDALLTQADVRAATKKSDGIFDGDPTTYTLPEYIDAYGSDDSDDSNDPALFQSDAGSDSGSGSGSGSDDQMTAPAGCWDSITGFLSLNSLDTTDYPGYHSDRIWAIENDNDGGTEQLRQFVDQASAKRFFAAEKAWYVHCSEVREFVSDPDEWDQRDQYTAVQLPKFPGGVTVAAYTDAYTEVNKSPEYSLEVYLLRGDVVEALNFSPDDTSGSYVASPITKAVITAAAKRLAAGG